MSIYNGTHQNTTIMTLVITNDKGKHMQRLFKITFYIALVAIILYFGYTHTQQFLKSSSDWYQDKGRHLFQMDRQTQPFGRYKNGLSFNGDNRHYGVDYHLPEDTPILAASNGVVTRTFHNQYAGKVIEIREDNNTYYQWYAHLNHFNVKAGQVVKQGNVIGHSGNTGAYTTGPHLHFQRMEGAIGNANAIDPEPFIEKLPDKQYSLFHIE
ncbi:M23 family metallopeptidase [Staphylococcus americanisciuri]|uniref:lysostaphin n=1 Tax=Staphylococcus americanisciuri TaxID=2973940 RepID=A0ABT2F3P7_9STAP|nr:M23 family metallopeptidase [Staphylococcus americanisciuri]MCS4487083.1 M23 family metallopeptidase [Staphylococcus americanisciuri]